MHLMDLLAHHLFVCLFTDLSSAFFQLPTYQAVSEIFYGSRGAMPKCQSSGFGFDEPRKKSPPGWWI